MTPLEFIMAIRRRWKVIVVCVVIAVPFGWFLSPQAPASAPPTTSYKATTYLFTPPTGGARAPTNLLTVASLAELGPVPERTIEALDFDGERADLLAQIQVEVEETTGFLSVIATAPRAARASSLSETFADELLRYLDERAQERIQEAQARLNRVERQIARIDRRTGSGGGGGSNKDATDERTLLVTEQQTLSQELAQLRAGGDGTGSLEKLGAPEAVAVSTDPGLQAPRSRILRLLLAVAVGLAVGVGLSVVLARFDTRIYDRERVEEILELPVLAEIPALSRRERGSIVAADFPGTPAANAFQLLAAALRLGRGQAMRAPRHRRGDAGRSILVTSAVDSEGKSTTTANLAVAFAAFGLDVIVVCCDVHRPSLHATFGIQQGSGLSDLLTDPEHVSFDQAVHATRFDRVRVIPPGMAPGASLALLNSEAMRDLLLQAAAASDIVLIDTAPILATSDWTQLLPEVDAVLLVVRAGMTRKVFAERAAGVLDLLQAPVVGIALNGVSASSMKQGYGYRYHQAQAAQPAEDPGTAAPPPEPDPETAPPTHDGPVPDEVDAPIVLGAMGKGPAASENGAKADDPVITTDLLEAARALREGKRVRLKHERRSGSVGFLEVERVSSGDGRSVDGVTDGSALGDPSSIPDPDQDPDPTRVR